MIQLLAAILFAAVGALVGWFVGGKFAGFALKGSSSGLEMWRLGAEQGPDESSRKDAKRQLDRFSAGEAWTPVVTWFVRIVLAILGAGFGLGFAREVGLHA